MKKGKRGKDEGGEEEKRKDLKSEMNEEKRKKRGENDK